MEKNIFGKLKWLMGLSALNPYREGIGKVLKIYAYLRILLVLFYFVVVVFGIEVVAMLLYFLSR